MLKKLLILVCGLGWLIVGFANTTLDYSYVTITNNTDEKVSINSALLTNDSEFERGTDWDSLTLALAPYETKQVLWFRRLQDIKPNELYLFNLYANNSDYSNQNMLLTFLEKGKPILSSEIATDLTLPLQTKQRIFNKSGLYEFFGEFWGSKHIVYGMSWLPLGNLYNSYHFVIDKPVENVIKTPSSQQISILSYNTQLMPFYAGVVDDLNQPDIRVKDIPKKISQFDVVILEELFDRDLRNKIVRLMEANYPYHTTTVGQHTSRVLTGGVMIFSKWPIIKENQFIFQASTGIDSLAAKGVMYAAINKQGKMYHVIGTHMQADRNSQSIVARNAQLHEMADFITGLHIPANEPLLIGGDFNIDQFSIEFDNLLTQLNVNLLDNMGYPYSVDGVINTMQVDKIQARIDYIFYSNDHAKPRKAFNNVFILRDLDNGAMWPKFDLSDHFPVLGYFDFSA